MTKSKNTSFRSVDKLAKELDNVDNFVLKNWKKYVYLAAGVIVIVTAVLYIYESKEKGNLKESQEIFTAKTSSELQDVIKKYPDAKSVNFSRLDLAAKYFESKDYDKAIAAYQDEIDNGNNKLALNLAKLNKSYIIAVKGDKDVAVADFIKIADDNKTPEFIRAEAAYASGSMLMKMGKKDEALKYLKLCVSFKDSKGWAKFAKSLIDTSV
jgi:hypothetical protein